MGDARSIAFLFTRARVAGDVGGGGGGNAADPTDAAAAHGEHGESATKGGEGDGDGDALPGDDGDGEVGERNEEDEDYDDDDDDGDETAQLETVRARISAEAAKLESIRGQFAVYKRNAEEASAAVVTRTSNPCGIDVWHLCLIMRRPTTDFQSVWY